MAGREICLYNLTSKMRINYPVVVVGGGHAGAEAAWAIAHLGVDVAMVTMDPSRIAQMSCNPAIGGLAKGQMVREIDALGGLMGIAIDNTAIQVRMLNRSKGQAVWGPRAQADKYKYAAEVQRLLANVPNITIIPGEVADLETDDTHKQKRITAVLLADGTRLQCKAAIITTGTFLRGLMHTGEHKTIGGRVGERSANALSTALQRLGLELGRLKTGTPPRIHRDSIDYSKFALQPGDDHPLPFSYLNEYAGNWTPPLPQVHCWLGETNLAIHELIRANLHRAPMYSGQIHSTGPRYCPSIEDKVVRFADKQSHHLFLEPEGLDTDEIYCNGISTSLPDDVQQKMVPLIPGLEKARFLRYGYAVEYDMVWPTQIYSTLQTKPVDGLFLAGQINGTSGYEEAAAQGLIAGVNAAKYVQDRLQDFILRRDQAYMGVLIDDLVTKPPTEPYRMFTSRAEYRLSLRYDNADERLTEIGRSIGLVNDQRWDAFQQMRSRMTACRQLLGSGRALELLRQPQHTWETVSAIFPHLQNADPDAGHRIAVATRYHGYLARQSQQIEKFAKLDRKQIPARLDYSLVQGLRNEAKQKFKTFTPHSLGQALRISGITPTDITVLAIHLSHHESDQSIPDNLDSIAG